MNLQTYLMIKSAYYDGMEKDAFKPKNKDEWDEKQRRKNPNYQKSGPRKDKNPAGPTANVAPVAHGAGAPFAIHLGDTDSTANTIPASLITSESVSSPMYTDSINVDGNGPVRDDEVLQALDTTPQTLADYRKAILADQRGQGMTVGNVAGGVLGGVGGYYGTKWLNKKLGLTKDRGGWRKNTGRLLSVLGTLGAAAGGAYLGGEAGHGITRSLQNRVIARHGGDSDMVADKIMANANRMYDKYNI